MPEEDRQRDLEFEPGERGPDKESLLAASKLVEKKLLDFGVQGSIETVRPGPVITMYELEPAPGVKINKIANLSDDLALALKAPSVRIVAPIPGKNRIGFLWGLHDNKTS